MDAKQAFSASYAEARRKFLALAERRDAKLISRVHPSELGHDGEELAMDFAMFGDPNADRSLLVISGTHGQEGFTGSAIQLAFLENLEIPDGVNIVLLHALNPWGYSHLSRTDDANIDLNRNFRDFSKGLPKNPIYSELHPALCPENWNEATRDWTPTRDRIIAERGLGNFLSGLTGGQFENPKGMSYGGTAPAWSNTTVAELLPQILRNTRKLAFAEWHTGLGAYGELCHICVHDAASPNYSRVFEWLGEEARATMTKAFDGAAGITPSYTGAFSAWLPGALPWAETAGLAMEIGTYDNEMVTDALRIDLWLKFGKGSQEQRTTLRSEMMDRLCPTDPVWRNRAIANGCDAQAQMLRGLIAW
jgi:hypothetical protein